MRSRLAIAALAATLAAIGVLAAAPGAFASYHLTKIREISGDPGSQNNGYIELQMYASGQNLVSGHDLTFWDNDGLVLGMPVPVQTITLSGPNPPNAETQRTILIGDSAVAGRDFTVDLTPYFDAGIVGNTLVPAGAVCFEAIPVDCVSWGGPAFTGAANLPDNATPFGTALPTATALRRDISRGCATALDVSDDTNDNAADFAAVARDPTPNSPTPIEQPCGPGGGGGQDVFCGGKRATRVGSNRANVLVGTARRDVIAGLGGNDTIRGLAANDVLCGGAGKDKLIGGRGRDRLLGQAGKDTCKGGPNRDTARSCEIKRTI